MPVARALWMAHHPLCGRFDDHLAVLRGHRLCLGCLTSYPSAAALLLLAVTNPVLAWAGPVELATLTLGLLSLNLLRLLGVAGRVASLLPRLALGMAAATAVLLLWSIPEAALRLVAALAILAPVGALFVFKARSFLARCTGCPFLPSRPACPGLRPHYSPRPLPPPMMPLLSSAVVLPWSSPTRK